MGKAFKIFVTQSAHTDIGYTHPQGQIMRMYLDYYEQVLELCRQTEHDPESHRFKWVCETSWQVKHFLENCPEREEEFLSFVRKGQIEITAGYLNYTDLIDSDAYARSLDWVIAYCQKHQLPLNCVMHADINGWPWGLADVLAEKGIRYFISHVHIDSATDPLGERGSVHYQWLLPQSYGDLLNPDSKIRIPQAFWWQGPGGGRVFHWLNEHYHLGNFLGLSGAQSFPPVKKSSYYYELDSMTVDQMYQAAAREVPRYITRLRQAGYPYNVLVINTSGFFTDNSAPDIRWCELIRRWNEEHTDITLQTATMTEWFEALESEIQGELPTYQAAWPDHWAHGLGSETSAVALARQTQRRRAGTAALITGAGSPAAKELFEKALEEERFALEHTFNAWCTTYRPASPLIPFEQMVKELFYYQADQYLDEAIAEALRAISPGRPGPGELYVYSTAAQAEQRLVHFDALDHDLQPGQHGLEAGDGQIYLFQRDDLSIPRFAALLPLSPGVNRFKLVEGQQLPEEIPAGEAATLENEAWRIVVDPARGGLSSLVERQSGREWAESGPEFSFGQVLHETVVHPRGREACGNTRRLIDLGVASEKLRAQMPAGPVFHHEAFTFDPAVQVLRGPVFDTLRQYGNNAAAGALRVDWRLYHGLPIIELNLEWDKHWCDLPEAAYVVFPFQVSQAQLALESGGGFFYPGSHAPGGQMPGTCSSYYTIQRAARIEQPGESPLLWLPLDAPLVMTNEINYNRWETAPYQWNGLLGSMPVNHYWHTNFPASQRGYLKLRYRLISQQGWPDAETALRAAMPEEVTGWR